MAFPPALLSSSSSSTKHQHQHRHQHQHQQQQQQQQQQPPQPQACSLAAYLSTVLFEVFGGAIESPSSSRDLQFESVQILGASILSIHVAFLSLRRTSEGLFSDR